VGGTQEADKENMDKHDFARASIMVRDVSKVPAVAPEVLGRCIYGFNFKMEVENEGQENVLMEKSSNKDAVGKGKEKDNNFDQYSNVPKKSSDVKSVMHIRGIHELYSLLDHFLYI
jgi:hypothetical protein